MSNASRFPTAAKYVIGFILGTALLITAAYLIENWRGDRAWAAEQRRLRELNLPLTFDELVPPMPPDEENFAMSPIMAPLFDITYTDPDNPVDRGAVWNQEAKRQQLLDLGASITAVYASGHWIKGRPADSAAMESQFLEKLRQVGAQPGANTSEPSNLRAAFRAIEPELAAIEEALRRPNAQFPVVYEHHALASLPHLLILIKFSKLYVCRAELALVDMGASAALEDILTSLKIANSLENEPILISTLVQTAMVNRSIQPIWEALRIRTLSEDQLRRLQQELTNFDLITKAKSAISGERIALSLLLDDIRSFDSLEIEIPSPLIKLAPRGWLQSNKALYSRMWEIHAASLINTSERRYFPERVDEVSNAIEAELSFWFDRKLAEMLAPPLEALEGLEALEKAAVRQTHVDLARTAIALERHYLANGSYPETLDALDPDFIEAVPHDVMTGEPLRYRREHGRFILYSVGVNQVDDGGTVVLRGSGSDSNPDPDQGDIVWSYFPLSEEPEE